MSRTLQTRFKERGTRFLIYPQPKTLRGFEKPVPVHVDRPPGTIKFGPEDDAICVVDAVDKLAYTQTHSKPPWKGDRHPRAKRNAAGHFNEIPPTHPTFRSATVYATIRCVLDIWEGYFGRSLPWYFRRTYPRLEVIPYIENVDAFSGDGYIEFGYPTRSNLLCENFDIVAHEMGHMIGWEVVGKPKRRSMTYRANDEACADVMAIVSALHFERVIQHLIGRTRGYLFSSNPLSRVGEIGRTRQLRRAFNTVRMSTVKWDPDKRLYKYNLSLPFTGGAYDILVLIYQEGLVARRAISKSLAQWAWVARRRDHPAIRKEFSRSHARRPTVFQSALLDARDTFGRIFARALDRTRMKARSHAVLARNMLAADAELHGGRYGPLIRASFARREIALGTGR